VTLPPYLGVFALLLEAEDRAGLATSHPRFGYGRFGWWMCSGLELAPARDRIGAGTARRLNEWKVKPRERPDARVSRKVWCAA